MRGMNCAFSYVRKKWDGFLRMDQPGWRSIGPLLSNLKPSWWADWHSWRCSMLKGLASSMANLPRWFYNSLSEWHKGQTVHKMSAPIDLDLTCRRCSSTIPYSFERSSRRHRRTRITPPFTTPSSGCHRNHSSQQTSTILHTLLEINVEGSKVFEK